MKISLVYFTSTGNTLWGATRFKQYLEEKQAQVNLYEVKKDRESIDLDVDLLGIFYPVWGTELPRPLEEWLETIAERTGKLFFIGNYAHSGGDTGINAIQLMKGWQVVYVDYYKMPLNCGIPYSFFGVKTPFPIQTCNTEPDQVQKFLAKAAIKLESMAQDIIAGKQVFKGGGIVSKWLSEWQRADNPNYYALANEMYVEEGMCNKCSLCYKLCPVENIHIEADQFPTFDDKCLMCLKCYNLCPKNAIQITSKSLDMKRFIRYKGPGKKIRPVLYR